MKLTVELKSEAICQNCGEVLSPCDDVVYWEGNNVIDPHGYGVLREGLYHTECYEANK